MDLNLLQSTYLADLRQLLCLPDEYEAALEINISILTFKL